MKIEKVNDNQIRCTLTREDLAERQIKLSELAYGTEKAKALFRELMQQAAYEFGFEAEDIPLMIEAIPQSSDTIILIITKVECPEELDTRFSHFSRSNASDDASPDKHSKSIEKELPFNAAAGADDILDFFRKLQEEQNKLNDNLTKKSKQNSSEQEQQTSKDTPNIQISVDITKLFVFRELDVVRRLARVLKGFYQGKNTLYKDISHKKYYLVINNTTHTPEEFNKVCNILSEYAQHEKCTAPILAYLAEHHKVILKDNALQVLADL